MGFAIYKYKWYSVFIQTLFWFLHHFCLEWLGWPILRSNEETIKMRMCNIYLLFLVYTIPADGVITLYDAIFQQNLAGMTTRTTTEDNNNNNNKQQQQQQRQQQQQQQQRRRR